MCVCVFFFTFFRYFYQNKLKRVLMIDPKEEKEREREIITKMVLVKMM